MRKNVSNKYKHFRQSWAASTFFVLALLTLSVEISAQRVIVFSFEQDRGTPATEWIGTGLAVALDESLLMAEIPCITYDEMKRYYELEGMVKKPQLSGAAKVALAKQFGAAVAGSGSYSVEGDMIRTRMRVWDVSSDLREIGRWEDEEKLQNLLSLSRQLLDHLLRAIAKNPPPYSNISPEAFESYIRGRITDDPTLQEVYFRRALELAPEYDNAACHLAAVLREKGRIEDSKRILDGLEKKKFAKAYLSLLLLAEFRMAEGRHADAQRLLMASLNAREGAEAHLALAKLYIKVGKPDEALKELAIVERFGSFDEEIEAVKQELRPPKEGLATGTQEVEK